MRMGEATGATLNCRVGDRHESITFGQMITRDHPIDVLFVIVPHSLLLDIAGPAEAFRLANQHRRLRGLPPRFRLRFAAPNQMQDTSVGLSIAGLEPLPEEFCATTWVVVVGQPTEHLGDVAPAKAVTARERRRTSPGHDLLGHAAGGARGPARWPALHDPPRVVAGVAGARAAGV